LNNYYKRYVKLCIVEILCKLVVFSSCRLSFWVYWQII